MIYRLVKDFDLVINIVKANVNPQKEGTMVLEVEGEQSARDWIICANWGNN